MKQKIFFALLLVVALNALAQTNNEEVVATRTHGGYGFIELAKGLDDFLTFDQFMFQHRICIVTGTPEFPSLLQTLQKEKNGKDFKTQFMYGNAHCKNFTKGFCKHPEIYKSHSQLLMMWPNYPTEAATSFDPPAFIGLHTKDDKRITTSFFIGSETTFTYADEQGQIVEMKADNLLPQLYFGSLKVRKYDPDLPKQDMTKDGYVLNGKIGTPLTIIYPMSSYKDGIKIVNKKTGKPILNHEGKPLVLKIDNYLRCLKKQMSQSADYSSRPPTPTTPKPPSTSR
ncbi:MAG: hypothetical protein AB7F59_13300 [Bdellovibrionales bacterium]